MDFCNDGPTHYDAATDFFDSYHREYEGYGEKDFPVAVMNTETKEIQYFRFIYEFGYGMDEEFYDYLEIKTIEKSEAKNIPGFRDWLIVGHYMSHVLFPTDDRSL
jgi:hypothetical protein